MLTGSLRLIKNAPNAPAMAAGSSSIFRPKQGAASRERDKEREREMEGERGESGSLPHIRLAASLLKCAHKI